MRGLGESSLRWGRLPQRSGGPPVYGSATRLAVVGATGLLNYRAVVGAVAKMVWRKASAP